MARSTRGLIVLALVLVPAVGSAQQPLKFPTDPVACNGASEGGQYANTTTHKLRYCDGTAWADVATGAGGGPATWGDIGGDTADQLDMMALFDTKQPLGNFSGVGGCGANQFVTVLNEDTAPTCAAPVASTVLDTLGSTRGSILFRGASAWTILAPGTLGDVLTSNGAGADPTYQTPAGGGGGLSHAQILARVSLGF